MIGMTGHTGGGAPAIKALSETVGGYIEGRSLVEMKNDLWSIGVVAEVPTPTYGYMVESEFYFTSMDEDIINDWALDTLRGLIHTDRKGRGAGEESPICQIPWGNTQVARACRWGMRYTRWGKIQRISMGTIGRIASGLRSLAKRYSSRRE